MVIGTTVVGSYPKPPEEGQPFALRKTLHALERGEATETDLRAAQDDLVTEVVREQEAAGVDVLTDGQVRWDDILTPFARNIAGFEVGGLLRWFDNNVYYRRPVCVGPLEWRGASSVESWRFAQSLTERPVKAVIPGPITFARLSVDEHYNDHEAFVEAIADVLAQELFELQAAGVGIIQVDEPALLQAPEDLALARAVLESMTADLTAETILATYFGDAKRLGAELFDLPVDTVGLDFIAGPENSELIGSLPDNKRVQAGVIDARNTMLEPLEELVATISSLRDAVGAERLTVSPSCGLEYLPREKARTKLARLSEAAGKVGEE